MTSVTKNTSKSDQATPQYHVASLVAYAMKNKVSAVQAAITHISGAEVHAISEEGKIVFTLEGDSYKTLGRKMDEIRLHEGLINLSPVYH